MNYTFSTRSERIAVIEDLRKPGIYFPRDWDPLRTQQRESELLVFGFGFGRSFFWILMFFLLVITWILQHQPDDRPTALELSQSPLLPQRLEDEYFKSALKLMSSSYHRMSIHLTNLL
jgi:translation initiation factor 2-alpha kinase 4